MSAFAGFLFGVVSGLLGASVAIILSLARFIATDLEGFRKWLDRGMLA